MPAVAHASARDHWAQHEDGYWLRHRRRVKSALIRDIGGKRVRNRVKDVDRYCRVDGVVYCANQNVGGRPVRESLAIAAHGEAYEDAGVQA